ncbi:MAG: hypothetical protein R3359_08990 [Marinirhabdus sp.]|nr:hypothetical protein [Marinirhabdus sp.]
MKFKYPKRKKTFNLIIGLLWIGLGVFGILEDDARKFEYIGLGLGVIYFGLALYMQVASYVSIDEAQIVKHNLVPIKFPLSEITRIKVLGNAITIEKNDKKMKIYKNNIQKKQRPILEEAIAKIETEYLNSEKN